MAEDHVHCIDAGMDEILSKPFTRIEMKALLLQRLSVGCVVGDALSHAEATGGHIIPK